MGALPTTFDAKPARLTAGLSGKAIGVDELTVSSAVRAGTIEIVLAGALDMGAAFGAESEVDRLLATPAIDAVALDLGDVDFLDSAGLGTLLSIRDHATRRGLGLRITRMSSPVERILDATATRGIFGP